MPDSFEAIAVLALALLPGALYVWAFEREAGRWGVGLSDRLFRFVGGSAIFHVAVAPATYWVWTNHWQTVQAADPLPWALWPIAILYVALPVGAGGAVGNATRRGREWVRWFTGPYPAPRAWDHLFHMRRTGGFGFA